MKQKKNTLVILDAHALIHRSFHALPSFTSASGEPMGAVYGVSAVLLKLIRELEPTHIAAAFDREEPTFRHIAYEKYKATRAETKSDLIPQFEKVKELFTAFGIPILEVPGFEADDIIGTLVDRFRNKKDLTIIIASGDMDTLQLVDNERIFVYTLRRGIEETILYDEKKVEERFGFPPKYITDFKGLKGDPSDNIIGVKGIGEKTATEIIQHYGTIEDLYRALKKKNPPTGGHPAWLKDRVAALLLENEEDALFSKELATIRRDAPVAPELDDLVFGGIPVQDVARVFRKFHFPSLISRLPKPEAEDIKKIPDVTKLTQKTWDEFENTSRDISEIILFIEEETLHVGFGDRVFELANVDAEMLSEKLARFFLREHRLVSHDAKELYRQYPFIPQVSFDLTIAAWVCDSERKTFELADIVDESRRGGGVLEGIRAASLKYQAKIEKDNLKSIYYDIELPLTPILVEIEKAGILVDLKKLAEIEKRAEYERSSLEKEIQKLASERFDVNSPKQLSHILFDVLKLSTKGIKKTSTKNISTQFSELAKLRGAHPIIDLLIRYRELAKLLSTYITTLPKLIESDGRIHTTLNQTGTTTGRLSSANPNLQNIPIRTELGREIRSVFVAPPGFELVSFDYSQLELRIAAELSEDEKLLGAFRKGEDVHARTASEIFNVARADVTQEMRRRAKTINFGILYGMGARALAQGIGVSVAEAEQYLAEYLRDFPGIEEYRERVVREGREKGYVQTLFGRRRSIINLRSSFDFVRKEAERMAVNAPIQGTAADLIKRAMVEITRTLKLGKENLRVRMLLQVHDELLFEIEKKSIREYIPTIRDIMERTPELSVPIVVDAKHGPNWQDMFP